MRRFFLLVIWTVSALATSTLLFGAINGAQAFAFGGRRGPRYDLEFAWSITTYGAGHWLLLSLVTLPLFQLPIAAWVAAARFSPKFEDQRRLCLSAALFAALGTGVRIVALEYPSFKLSPLAFFASYITSALGIAECLALLGGLLLPRIIVPTLRGGAFLDPPITGVSSPQA